MLLVVSQTEWAESNCWSNASSHIGEVEAGDNVVLYRCGEDAQVTPSGVILSALDELSEGTRTVTGAEIEQATALAGAR